jgi:predicted GNAT superfamily acetyltransferase
MKASSMDLIVRLLERADLGVVHAINQANVPEVGDATVEHLAWLVGESDASLVAEVDGTVVGYLIALGPGSSYTSPNYTWFAGRYDDFLYVDRVAVVDTTRGLGVGSALYDAAEQHAREHGISTLTCEVNVRPPNPTSLRFHERRGFVQVGEQDTYGATIRVRLLAKEL